MAWQEIDKADVMTEWTPDEANTIKIQQGAVDNIPAILARVVAEIRDYIRSGDYAVDLNNATTLPLGLHNDAITIARWRLLLSLPQAKTLETDVRERAYQAAMKKLDAIAKQDYVVEPPAPPSATSVPRSGQWNSLTKLIMRTQTIPTPTQQIGTTSVPGYANPNAPADTP